MADEQPTPAGGQQRSVLATGVPVAVAFARLRSASRAPFVAPATASKAIALGDVGHAFHSSIASLLPW